MAAGDRAGQPQRHRGGHRVLVRPGRGTRPDLARRHADSPDGAEQSAQPPQADDAGLRSAIVNVAGYYLRMAKDRDAGRDGGDHLAERQHGRRRPWRVMCGFRQPDARAGCAGGRPAELGDRGHVLSVAIAEVGRRPGRPEPGLARRHLHPAGCRSSSPLAPARRRLRPAAGRLGAVRGPRRSGARICRRCPAHDRWRLAAEFLGQRARVPGSAEQPGRRRLRQQRSAW